MNDIQPTRRPGCLPKVLSVVGQQVMTIQLALKGDNPRITFEGSDIIVKPGFGVFITMNPGYAGRYGIAHLCTVGFSTTTRSATTVASRLRTPHVDRQTTSGSIGQAAYLQKSPHTRVEGDVAESSKLI